MVLRNRCCLGRYANPLWVLLGTLIGKSFEFAKAKSEGGQTTCCFPMKGLDLYRVIQLKVSSTKGGYLWQHEGALRSDKLTLFQSGRLLHCSW